MGNARVHRNNDWRIHLHRNGYAVFPGLCPAPVVRAAIDHDLATNYDAAAAARVRQPVIVSGPRSTAVLLPLLLDSGIIAKLDEVIDFDKRGHDGAQIAIRWAANARRPSPPEPHIDGLPPPFNAVPAGTLVSNFAVLVAIYLSLVREQFAGNFTVRPGSHHILEQHFHQMRPEALRNCMPRIQLGEPVQLMTEPGDVVLCHYGLAHTAAVNLSAIDRYAVYFRLRPKDIEQRRWHLMTQIWDGWDGWQQAGMTYRRSNSSPVVRDHV